MKTRNWPSPAGDADWEAAQKAGAEKAIAGLRPHFQADGGDLEVIRVTENGEVRVQLTGNCRVCAVNKLPLKAAVRQQIRAAMPHIQKVTFV